MARVFFNDSTDDNRIKKHSIMDFLYDEEASIPKSRLLMVGSLMVIMAVTMGIQDAFAGHRSHRSHSSHRSHRSGNGAHSNHSSHSSHNNTHSSHNSHSNHSNHSSAAHVAQKTPKPQPTPEPTLVPQDILRQPLNLPDTPAMK